MNIFIFVAFAQGILGKYNERMDAIDNYTDENPQEVATPAPTLPPTSGNGTSSLAFEGAPAKEVLIEDKLSLRDPFNEPADIITDQAPEKKKQTQDFVFGEEPKLDRVPIGRIKIISIYFGATRRALAVVEGSTTPVYTLKEGMKIGANNDAEIKAILPSGIVAVEQFKNIYNKDEYLETIIPITGE